MTDDDYVYDEASGEWVPSRARRGSPATPSGSRRGRQSTGRRRPGHLIKDLTVKGAGQTLKRGTLIKSIRLTGDAAGNRLPL